MEELSRLVARSQAGDLDAYGQVVRQVQDMAYGYAYSLLGDFHLAEDAAQEAFVSAYCSLSGLRDHARFPGWFRRIVFTSCQRLKRKGRLRTVSIEAAAGKSAGETGPAAVAEKKEATETVLAAIKSLPKSERTATTLFYINGYSQAEIADFLEVPVTTVNNRLHTSRKRLKERMMNMVADEMKAHPLPDKFPERIRLLLELPRPLEIQGHPVRALWEAFKRHFGDSEMIELPEIQEKKSSLWPRMNQAAYEVDAKRILHPELTSQLVELWRHRPGPVRWITSGRVFRRNEESQTSLEVHHQAEALWAGRGLRIEQFHRMVQDVAAAIIPSVKFQLGNEGSYPPVSKAYYYRSPWRGQWLNVCCGGMVDRDFLTSVGLDPARDGAISFAFGLDRCVQVRDDLDDIRKLWHPPYVPEVKK